MPQYQGVWTLEQQAQAQSNQQWVTDPNFKNTTLLLQADGTGSGSQNNTFLDGSTNNFFVTRYGNTTQGSFSPFSQAPGYWGNYFDGSSYLSIANDANLNLGSSNFTIEFWVYAPSSTSPNAIISKGTTSSLGSDAWSVEWINTTGTLGYGCGAFNGWASPIVTGTVTLNAWNHVAVVRNGTTHTLYVNGISASTATASYTVTSAGSLYIGTGWYAPSSRYFVGYVSNARLVIGTAVYTSNFAPSTTPLTAITNTQLLTCQNNRFIDNSANAFAFTVTGTPSVQAFGPFAPALQWTPDVVGGSGYFDGTGDYLTASGANAALGAGTFTIDGWFYLNSYNGGAAVYSGIGTYPDSSAFMFYINASGAYSLNVGNSDILNTGTAPLNTWIHFAIVRSSTGSNGLALYINGTSIATVTSSTNFTSTNAVIGRTGVSTNSNLMFGYLSGIRVVVGSANVPSGVPTSPPTAITNTQLLLNYTNAGIYDGKMANNLETVGNAQVATSPVKYGSGSIFAGPAAADYVLFPYSPNLNFGAGDFTIECWLFWTGGTSENTLIMNNASGGVNLALTNSGTWQIGTSYVAWQNDFGTTPTKNTWNHLAVSRNGTVIKAFINGVQIYVGTNSTNYTNTSTWYIAGNGAAAIGLIGYVDDFRISRFARYFTTFTPPQQALPRQ